MKQFTKPRPSPYQPRVSPQELRRESAANAGQMIREEVRKLCLPCSLDVSFEEDKAALATFSYIPGYVAVLCTISRDGIVVGQGRGAAVATRMNRSIERVASSAVSGSFMSAANAAMRVLEAVRVGETPDAEPISEKQKALLTQLAYDRVDNEDERERLLSAVPSMSKTDASELIASFLGAR